jgi:hypothetical protein
MTETAELTQKKNEISRLLDEVCWHLSDADFGVLVDNIARSDLYGTRFYQTAEQRRLRVHANRIELINA